MVEIPNDIKKLWRIPSVFTSDRLENAVYIFQEKICHFLFSNIIFKKHILMRKC